MPSSSPATGYVRQLWLKWKALRLPWRRQFLIGADLAGNTFWEFKDALNANRWRRIVKYPRSTHYGDIKISPQWHQWLRHTRDEAPSIEEQQFDVSRQAMLKQLATAADERWRSKPSYLDVPSKQQPTPATEVEATSTNNSPVPAQTQPGVQSAVEGGAELVAEREGHAADSPPSAGTKSKKRLREENPWKGPQRGAPSENWQPQSWTPGPARRG